MQTNLCCRCLHALLTIQTIWFGPFGSLNLIHLLIKMTHIMGSKLLSWVARVLFAFTDAMCSEALGCTETRNQ